MTKVLRGFEVVKGYEEKGINLPIQSTKSSAGFDFEASQDYVIPSIWRQVFRLFKSLGTLDKPFDTDETKPLAPTLVKTGIKAYMQEDEGLFLHNRSSNPIKKFIHLTNGVGVVDSDYYENEDNDGEIMFQFINFGLRNVRIQKGDKIGQGIFQKYLKADEGKHRKEYAVRTGGHGSTN